MCVFFFSLQGNDSDSSEDEEELLEEESNTNDQEDAFMTEDTDDESGQTSDVEWQPDSESDSEMEDGYPVHKTNDVK